MVFLALNKAQGEQMRHWNSQKATNNLKRKLNTDLDAEYHPHRSLRNENLLSIKAQRTPRSKVRRWLEFPTTPQAPIQPSQVAYLSILCQKPTIEHWQPYTVNTL